MSLADDPQFIELLKRFARIERAVDEMRNTEKANYSSFTPTLTQGASITISSSDCRYIELGGFQLVAFYIVTGSAGTAANAIKLGGFPRSVGFGDCIGAFHVQDTGIQNYAGSVVNVGSGLVGFLCNTAGDVLGISPAYTLSANDTISGFIVVPG